MIKSVLSRFKTCGYSNVRPSKTHKDPNERILALIKARQKTIAGHMGSVTHW